MTLDSAHVDNSIARALKGESYLDPGVLKINGFSTNVMRHLFSNLCHLDGIAYLEIGVFKAASFVAAFNNNPITAVGIDDFSQDFSQKNVREECLTNIEKWKGTAIGQVIFIEGDCFHADTIAHDAFSRMNGGFAIYAYDGHHDTLPTSKALPVFFDLLADRFIFIVDDFLWATVSAGVTMGFESLEGRVQIVNEWTLVGKRRQDDPVFHNGLALFLCEKIK